MYYDIGPEEQARVELAAFFGIDSDPIGHRDMAVVIVFSVLLLFGLFANIYVWCNRRYAPLKAKNIPLMTGIYLHSVFFFFGDLTLCGLVHIRGPFFGNCVLMLIWFRSMLGNFSLGALLTIRSFKLYRVFCINKPMYGYKRCIPYIIFVFIIIFIGTVSTAIPRSMTVDYLEGVEFCIFNQHLVTTYCVLLWFVWAVYMLMVWLLRNVRSSFNEFREMAASLALLIICTICNQAMLYRIPRLPTKFHWRVLLLVIDQITANYIWWLIMFKPIVNCMFRHDKYLTYWKQKMIADGLTAQYGVGPVGTEMSSNSHTLVQSQNGHQAPATATIKIVKSEPSYTESTRMAINQLAAFSESRAGHLDTPVNAEWTDVQPIEDPPEKEDVYSHRRSISCAQQAERRKSEPFISTTCTLDGAGNACSHDRCLKYRMLSQRVLSHHDVVDNSPNSRSSSPRSALGILGLEEDIGDDATAAPDRTTASTNCMQRPVARSSEMNRWQYSDTDLSLLSSGCSGGGRRLL
ncbi:hypothetical protein GGI25_003568 [Coemansia spiralis]|uniref:G-protein coupled receptors family 3 profile domain-containing protein n=2 Tax=Coemansia TaxID=4863 RepID=A0A9W8KWD4_9FUNG|nr:hypothetical protein BX070DRAFT_226793 [Coemansia spiralis]KAJ1991124.1 hypothetical protein EDC05_003602 [Coemansia umbellata]KAJ2621299.1 hypothetical protein GGI26_004273 [Coemansia sp. RSA 1358]KAJ2676418.1 hypothetical protein GGI25_003568 [Coemansia spiralis]